MNVLNARHRDRLYKAIENSWKNMRNFRKSRALHVKAFAGTDYGRSLVANMAFNPSINLIQQTAEAYSVALAYNCPQFHFQTRETEREPFRRRFQASVNQHVKRINLDEEIRQALLDAMFRLGVIRTFVGEDPSALYDNYAGTEPGTAQARRVSVDNLVLDMTAGDFREMGYACDRWLMRLEDLMEDPTMDADSKDLVYSRVGREQAFGSTEDSSLASYITHRGMDRSEMYHEDHVWLAHVWLPEERQILVVPVDRDFKVASGDAMPLKIIEWEANATGPYSYLTLGDIPDNVMPYSIIENLYGLHILANNLVFKNAMRAKNQKDLWVYESGAEGNAKEMRDARDQSMIRVDDISKVNLLKAGGVDGGIGSMTASVLDLFNRSSGNVEMMSGLGSVAPTARQEQLLQQQAGKREAEMDRRVGRFVEDVGSNLAEMLFDDDISITPAMMEFENTGMFHDASLYPSRFDPRPGSFRDYQMSLVPYSMPYRSPQQRLAQIREVVGMTSQMMPLIQQQGGQFDAREYYKMEAEYGNLPEVSRLIRFNMQPQEVEEQVKRVGGNSGGEYIHRNVSDGPSPSAQQQMLAQQMQSAESNSQPMAM